MSQLLKIEGVINRIDKCGNLVLYCPQSIDKIKRVCPSAVYKGTVKVKITNAQIYGVGNTITDIKTLMGVYCYISVKHNKFVTSYLSAVIIMAKND